MALKLTNNAVSTIAAAIAPGDTTISIAAPDAGRFPVLAEGDWFPLYLLDSAGNSEIVRVTARAGSALMVARAQEGTTAKAFPVGARADLRFTAAAVDEVLGPHEHPMSAIVGLLQELTAIKTELEEKAEKLTTYTMQEVAALIKAGGVPIGASIPWNSPTIPDGFLKENGAAISRTVYPELFAKIGTVHGAGDGSTTFNVPDSRGLVIRGLDEGRGLDPGRVIGSYQADQNQSHTHGVNDPGHYHGFTAIQRLGFDGVIDARSDTASWQDADQQGSNTNWAATGIWLSASGGAEARMKNTAKIILIRAF